MSTRIVSWNIKEFGKKRETNTPVKIRARVRKIAQFVRDEVPDIFGILEVESIDILSFMQDEFPNFDFGVTDGPKNNKEILVGWRRGEFDQAAFTQKRQFDLYNPYLRPGALLSISRNGAWLNVLFLHTDSGTEARDFGNRYEMVDKIWSLRKSLDKKTSNKPENLIVMGDLNTMGLHFPYRRKSHYLVDGLKEIYALEQYATKNRMKVLKKSHDKTWASSSKNMTSDLDHAIASDHLTFDDIANNAVGDPVAVSVTGWVDKTPAQRLKFIEEVSDHCAISLSVDF
ncbi:MAG: endonuclease/exonuclease/phosphatase family protein [Candidatus Thiodiazotropha sp. (ex Lucinoma borealis)]|nr:endonuclease/exonuclease/phosphatase family protein [Candidatus Thiodiazotropha sp. (ex Lucinoma borealis)]